MRGKYEGEENEVVGGGASKNYDSLIILKFRGEKLVILWGKAMFVNFSNKRLKKQAPLKTF